MDTLAAAGAMRMLDMVSDARLRANVAEALITASAAEARLRRRLRHSSLRWSALHEQLDDVDRQLQARASQLGLLPAADRDEARLAQARLRVDLALWRAGETRMLDQLDRAARDHDLVRDQQLGRQLLEALGQRTRLGGSSLDVRCDDNHLTSQLHLACEAFPSAWLDQVCEVRIDLVYSPVGFVKLARGHCMIGASTGDLAHQLCHLLISCLGDLRARMHEARVDAEQLCDFAQLLCGEGPAMDDQRLAACSALWVKP